MTSEVLREHPEILVNKTIKKTYQVLKVLGKGTFSVVYQCLNVESRDKLAIKGFPGPGEKMLNLQKKIYRILSSTYGNGQSGFPKYYQFGKTERFFFLVMERLSVSVQDIFIKLDHKISIKSVLNFGYQAIEIIEKVHKIGYIHRDIKPANFILGHGNKKDKIYLVDFGLARKITQRRNSQSGIEHRRSDDDDIHFKKKFIGTKRFASIASHLGVQQSKKDDLQSLGYILIYLLKGRLPWQGIKLANKPQQYETIGKIKQEIDLEEFCCLDIKDQIHYSGDVFLKLFRYLRVLKFGDTPNYQFLKKIFLEQLTQIQKRPSSSGFNRWRCKGKFDWMDEAQNQKSERETKQHRHSRQKQRRRSHHHHHHSSHSSKNSTQKDRYMK